MRARTVGRMERSAIRDRSLSGEMVPGFRGACHRARIRATRWLHPGYSRRRALVQRQPHQVAVVLAGIAVRRLVEGIGELPFLRLVAPLRCGMADDVVGTAGVADRRGTGSPIDYLPLDRLRPVLRDKVLRDKVLGDPVWVVSNGLTSLRRRNIGPASIREFRKSLASKLANRLAIPSQNCGIPTF